MGKGKGSQCVWSATGGSIIVQVKGDFNEINVGVPHLELISPDSRIPRYGGDVAARERRLLNAYVRATTFRGRKAQLDRLDAWARAETSVAVHVITGPGGAGKTRLALELIRRLDANRSDDDGWLAGFLTGEEMRRFAARKNLGEWGWQRPTLAVVDYAATDSEPLGLWLEELSANQRRHRPGPPLRILLLERHACPREGWLSRLIPGGDSTAVVAELFDPPEPTYLSPLPAARTRRAILAEMLRLCAKERGDQAALSLPEPGADETFDKLLLAEQWGDPLYLMMAAAAASEFGLAGALSMSRTDLGLHRAGKEIDRIERFAGRGGDGDARRAPLLLMAACATFARGLTWDQVRKTARHVEEIAGLDYPGGTGRMVADLHELLPPQAQTQTQTQTQVKADADSSTPACHVTGIQPDIVGEAFAYEAPKRASAASELAPRLLTALVDVVGREPLGMLMLLIQDYPGRAPADAEAGTIFVEPLSWLEGLIRRGTGESLPLLMAIADSLPRQTLILREMALDVHGAIRDRARVMQQESPSLEHESLLAASLNNVGNRLSDLGRREEALAASQEAVEIRRKLAADRPDAFLPDLAMSLNNVGNRLGDLGRREEALAASQEAVDIRRKLAADRPDAFLGNLATSLNNVGNRLGDLGRREEALAASQEAVEIRRKLAADRPDAFLPDLAMSLNNVGAMLSGLGRREEALAAAQEAVDIYRKLAADRPDAFLPDLARSLGARGAILESAERKEEALRSFEEGVRCLCPCFERYPEGHASLMAALVQYYFRLAETVGADVDGELLDPIRRVLQDLDNENEGERDDA